MLTQEYLKEIFDYKEGRLYWRDHPSMKKRRHVKPGQMAGCIRHDGYYILNCDGKLYLGHRLIWLYEYGNWPECEVDHIDGDPSNNSLDNLREVSKSENSKNSKLYSSNKTGYPGISFDKTRKKFTASVRSENVVYKLGRFETFELAKAARMQKEKELDFHENHGRNDQTYKLEEIH